MSKIFNVLVELGDELDKIGSIKIADELEELMEEVVRLQLEEEKALKIICPACNGEGFTEDSPFCDMCKGEGELAVKESSLNKMSFVRRKGNKWQVVSKKGKILGTYDTKSKALKRLRQVEYFKHNK